MAYDSFNPRAATPKAKHIYKTEIFMEMKIGLYKDDSGESILASIRADRIRSRLNRTSLIALNPLIIF